MSEDSNSEGSKPSWRRLHKDKPDRIVELIFAGSVVVFAFLGWRNSNSSSQQTDQLIAAAKISAAAAEKNAQASRNFAESARSINAGIDDAVGKLNLQAGALAESAVQAGSVARQTGRLALDTEQGLHVSQRAYIGLVQLSPVPQIDTGAFPQVVFVNSGHTIALHIRAYAEGFPGGVLVPKAIMSNPLDDAGSVENAIPSIPFSINPNPPNGQIMNQLLRQNILSGVTQELVEGRIDYEDLFGFSHWITFCRHSVKGGQWEACGKEYNQTDKTTE